MPFSGGGVCSLRSMLGEERLSAFITLIICVVSFVVFQDNFWKSYTSGRQNEHFSFTSTKLTKETGVSSVFEGLLRCCSFPKPVSPLFQGTNSSEVMTWSIP